MKTLFKIIFALICISFLWQLTPFSDMHIHFDSNDYINEWLVTNLLVVGVVFFAIALVLVIFISVFASVVFFAGLVGIVMLVLGMSFFWPLVLFALVMYWIFSDSKREAY